MDKNNDLNTIISQNIKAEIENSGKSKSEIARAIGVSNPTVSQYLSGRIQPSLATLSRLCAFLDCSADDILNIKK
ncbi:MAG: helix-turn-helix transcriptional regulator [Clostridia bacterium]|nr:helix-turn-helix transcriptional regulator [Clostridia bacterium]